MTNRNRIDRNPARYGMILKQAEAIDLLEDPIEFAQSMAQTIRDALFEDLMMGDGPQKIDEIREAYDALLGPALTRQDTDAARDVYALYVDFVTWAMMDSYVFGVGTGAVMEQLRQGLLGVFDLWSASLTQADVSSWEDLERIREKHKLPRPDGWPYSDPAKATRRAEAKP